ncbi:MAG: tripartite tricarboxylate transporter substrate binding protein [Burkholderiales bacterium]
MLTITQHLLRALIILIVSAGMATAADWKPDKLIELIVPTGPGSGVDASARTVQSIFQSNKLVEQAINTTNKPGGNYGIAMNYLGQFNGDATKLMVQTSTPLTAAIQGQIKLNYFEFTPIVNLISEPIAFVVAANSSLKSARDLTAKLKADPESVSIALSAARGNAFHITAALVARSVQADIKKMKIVVFNASSDGVIAAAGGHVDVMAATPATVMPLVQAGKVRIIGIASNTRLKGSAASVPTFKDQGIDAVFDIPRGFIGPRGLTAEQVRYWDGVFARMVKSDEWKQAVEKNQWVENYLNSADMAKELRRQHGILKDVLTELGMVQ